MEVSKLTIAKRAALNAGRVLMRYFANVDNLAITAKANNDFVSEADIAAEKSIVNTIHKTYPDHTIICEERGVVGPENSRYCWLVDPLDGTTNYIHGFPQFSVSIALKKNKETIVGVVYDPLKNELFEAVRGQSTKLNDRRIRVSGRNSLSGALLGTGVPYRNQHDLEHYLNVLRCLIRGTAGIRRAGAASLDLAYVAAGRLDGFWEFGLHPWDIAAGVLLVQEAGGMVGDMDGGNTYHETGHIVAASPIVFKKMIRRTRANNIQTPG